MKFIDLSRQYQLLEAQIEERIREILLRGDYINGPEVEDLEAHLGAYLGVQHAITCGNGTDAIELALKALGIGIGDHVFCPNFTFFATAEAILNVGATPILVDINDTDFNISLDDLKNAIAASKAHKNIRAKAIIGVDLFGFPADYAGLRALADENGMFLISDAAQSFGAKIGDVFPVTYCDVSTTSFFPSKPLGCYGDGGAIFTNSSAVADKLRSAREHGRGKDKYENLTVGRNSRLDTIQAGILLEKLKVFPNELNRRSLIASYYTARLKNVCTTPDVSGIQPTWAQYTVRIANREAIQAKLNRRGIPTAVYYKRCIHSQPAVANRYLTFSQFRNSVNASISSLSLPMSPYLTPQEIDQIAGSVIESQREND